MNDQSLIAIISLFFPNNEELAQAYHDFLFEEGIKRGLLGPREGDKLWDRHIFNSALLTERIIPGSTILDIGTGAGLPGIPIFLRDPSLKVYLCDTLERRTQFLSEFVNHHNLSQSLFVVRGRAESKELHNVIGKVDYIVARAVSSIGNLIALALPYFKKNTELLALKGKTVNDELEKNRAILAKHDLKVELLKLSVPFYNEDITVARIRRRQ